ncbi:glycine oxidase ThiO [Brevibacillus fluminis]|uniref:glycine oxidase n=1 Tax=Brevibacillus fluminis TaxID=511487 RepID=A0A3M8DI07_9BACL|nr:glycine oxidase ThiO [Brevibacillus fluminis]RNB87101.1 glycine oxidase ThiO [Brevibacillus fluminis]
MTSYDTAVIGGGVIGSSIAYHLAKCGQKVILLEKGRLAEGASSAAAGMLGAQAEEPQSEAFFNLACKSREMFRAIAGELKECSGIDIGLVSKGTLKVAMTEEQAVHHKRLASIHRQHGEQAEWLDVAAARAMEPNLSARICGGLYIEKDGHVQAPELSLAFAKAAAVLGTVVREHTAATHILRENGVVAGVETEEGLIRCDHAVVATGASGSEVAALTGIHVPVYPVKGECFSVTTNAPLLTRTVFADGCYLVPKAAGRIVVGATTIEGSFDRSVSLAGIAGLLAQAQSLVPAIADAQWEKAWAGLRPQTRDGLPYIGEVPDCKKLYVAAGHYRNGVLLSPITGEAIAALILGRTPRVSIEAFRLDRETCSRANADKEGDVM